MTRLLLALVLVLLVAAVAWAARRARRDSAKPRDVEGLPPLERDLLGAAERTWVVFTTEFCASCRPTAERLRTRHPEDHVMTLDVGDRPDLARRYGIRRAPTVMLVAADGTVLDLPARDGDPVTAPAAQTRT